MLVTRFPRGLRISQPALDLARQAGLDLSTLPQGPFITASLVQELAGAQGQAVQSLSEQERFDPQSILIYGAGGHGKAVYDLLRAIGTFRVIGFIDDGLARDDQIMDLPVLGGVERLAELYAEGLRLAVNAVGGIGDLRIRIKVFQTLERAGYGCPALAHPSAVVEPSASLAAGIQIFPQSYVGTECRLGTGVIVNTAAVVSHDCRLEDYANISPGALLAGGVRVGRGALVGMGVTVNLGVQVGAGARVGNGATVKSDVPPEGVVRAGTVWPPD